MTLRPGVLGVLLVAVAVLVLAFNGLSTERIASACLVLLIALAAVLLVERRP
jgi:membrane-bound ClpP family serine protease